MENKKFRGNIRMQNNLPRYIQGLTFYFDESIK